MSTPIKEDYGHEVYEQIKISVVLDGDLAATIYNAFVFTEENDGWDKVAFCDHVAPKLAQFLNKLNTELDIQTREEK